MNDNIRNTINELKKSYEKSKANETDKNLFGVKKQPDYSEPDFKPMNLEDEQAIDFDSSTPSTKNEALDKINSNFKDEAEPFTPKQSQSRRRGFRR